MKYKLYFLYTLLINNALAPSDVSVTASSPKYINKILPQAQQNIVHIWHGWFQEQQAITDREPLADISYQDTFWNPKDLDERDLEKDPALIDKLFNLIELDSCLKALNKKSFECLLRYLASLTKT